MIEPQSSQVNIPPPKRGGGFLSKLGAGLVGLAGAIGGAFTGGPAGAVAGAAKGATAGYTIGGMASGGGGKQIEPVGGEKTPMVRTLSKDPQAQNYALELGKQGLTKDDPRYAYIEEAQQKLKEKWGM